MWWNRHRNTEKCIIGVLLNDTILYCSITKCGYILNGVGETIARNIRDGDYAMNIIEYGDRTYMEENVYSTAKKVHSFTGSLDNFRKEIKDANYIYIFNDTGWVCSIYDTIKKAFSDYSDLRWKVIELMRSNVTK